MSGPSPTDSSATGTRRGRALGDDADRKRNVFERGVANAIRYPGVVYRLLFGVVTVFFVVMALFPIYWLVVLSVTPPDATYQLGVIPSEFTLANFMVVLDPVGMSPVPAYIFNSILVAGSTTVVVLVVASLAGYVFGRLSFPGRHSLLVVLLAVAYFPPVAFFVPLFQAFAGNLAPFGVAPPTVYDTPAAMIIPLSALTLPLAIFILMTFYAQVPDGLEDAARVEGATRLGALVRVILPLSKPGLAAAGVVTFIQVYNEFFFSYLMTKGISSDWAPIAPLLVDLRAAGATFAAAASVLSLIPVAVLLVLANEQIVQSIDASRVIEG